MISLIIFDLDGSLVESTKELHFNALNYSLQHFGYRVISKQDHESCYNALTTKQKLSILSEKGLVPIRKHKDIEEFKQEITFKSLNDFVKRDERLINLFIELELNGFKNYIATNSIKKTTEIVLKGLGLYDFCDGIVSNEDAAPKPKPDMLLKCMNSARKTKKETLLIGDSDKTDGLASKEAGIKFMKVNDPKDITFENIVKNL